MIGLNFFYQNLWECESFSARRLIKNFLPKIGKYEHWMTFCKSCKQPVRLNSLSGLTSKCAVYMLFLVLPGSVETDFG